MKQLAEALKQVGGALSYTLSGHAKERIRQRVGIESEEAATAWASEQIKTATKTWQKAERTHYDVGNFEIVCGGNTVVTVLPKETTASYLDKFNEVIAKESTKLLAKYSRELRKAEISVAEAQLNFLKAKNPNTKAIIQRRLVEATDRKAGWEDEIKAVELAARRYGITSL